ncbi:hypothetical protein A7982_13215 [Minicystis rosea]|nr:hypothetical protein A7982_13215 [Minicystis rosea]
MMRMGNLPELAERVCEDAAPLGPTRIGNGRALRHDTCFPAIVTKAVPHAGTTLRAARA